MKRSGIAAVTSIGLVVVAAGCGSAGVSTSPAQTPSTAPSPATSATSAAHKAGVGDTIKLADSSTGKNIAVTVVKVIDPDSSNNQIDTPPAGDRYESIQFRIVNTGTSAYQDDPLVEIAAKDAAGQNMQQDIAVSTVAGAQMPSSVSLAPGDTALGYVTFDVPVGDKIAQAQYSLNEVLSATAEWQIGNGQPAPATAPPTTSPTTTPTVPASPTATPTSPATTAPPTPTPPPTTSASSPESVVQQYFAAITAHNYALAWALGGKNVEGGSYNQFVQGFATTETDDVTIVSTSGDTVTIQLDATQTDGTHRYFAGTYTVENGVIVAAEIH